MHSLKSNPFTKKQPYTYVLSRFLGMCIDVKTYFLYIREINNIHITHIIHKYIHISIGY